MRAPVFILACSKGHKVTATEQDAEQLLGTACKICYRPLLVTAVKA